MAKSFSPQGVEQFEEVDWSGFYVDSGRL